jgi:L-iditol 2-dehydrogenase
MTWLWGSYAEFIKVPAAIARINLQELPSHLTYEEAAVTEPLACCLHGIEKCNIEPGDTIVIIGEGPIGLLHLQLARLMGGRTLIVCGLIDERLKKAEELGADITINAPIEKTIKEIKELTKGYGADVVIEAVGLPETWEEALRVVRKGGTVLEFGGCPPKTEIRVSTEQLHYGETTLIGAFHATPSDFRKALTLIASDSVKVKPIITNKMPLEKISEAFKVLTTSKKELKIAITS